MKVCATQLVRRCMNRTVLQCMPQYQQLCKSLPQKMYRLHTAARKAVILLTVDEIVPEGVAEDVWVACRLDKEREHAAALEVLPDLLHELDQMPPTARLTSLIQGILAGNIFDWGAKATVDLYHNGTILEIYR